MSETKTVMVRVTFTMPVEVPAKWDDETVEFNLEENHCMWTGPAGATFDRVLAVTKEPHYGCIGCALWSEVEVLWDEPVREVIPPTHFEVSDPIPIGEAADPLATTTVVKVDKDEQC